MQESHQKELSPLAPLLNKGRFHTVGTNHDGKDRETVRLCVIILGKTTLENGSRFGVLQKPPHQGRRIMWGNS